MARFLVPCRSKIVHWRGALEGLLPEGHLARFIWQTLCSMDWSELEAEYPAVNGGPGRPPYHPCLIAALWIYGMTQGLETAVSIAQACRLRDDFRWLAGGLRPSDQTLLNLLDKDVDLSALFLQVLQAMHCAGYVDLSAVFEDGTKMRANASPRSFRTAEEIQVVIEELKTLVAEVPGAAGNGTDEVQTLEASRTMNALQGRLRRAEQAADELRQRAERREGGGRKQCPEDSQEYSPDAQPVDQTRSATLVFNRSSFHHDAERDLLLCPAGEELRLIGTYDNGGSRVPYRLYGRRNCTGCPIKEQCTRAPGRRVKIYPPEEGDAALETEVVDEETELETTEVVKEPKGVDPQQDSRGPQASLTDPDSLFMLATSVKRWEPSFNADLSVTKDGVIVSQFLTKRPTDYHNFEPALESVISTLPVPEKWVGDGHYGTRANMRIAHRYGVALYAPTTNTIPPPDNSATTEPDSETTLPPRESKTTKAKSATQLFRLPDFRQDAERDVLICPAGEELPLIGIYLASRKRNPKPFALYGRRNCRGCSIKSRCTISRGRRVKVPVGRNDLADDGCGNADVGGDEPNDREDEGDGRNNNPGESDSILLQQHELRMKAEGETLLRLRRQTVEPVNAHLKQHGLGRFHVRGLRRCAAVLALACIAHNLMKWRTKEAAETIKPAA